MIGLLPSTINDLTVAQPHCLQSALRVSEC
jgi:hypothetical protein